jgi:hypothetical protein
MRSRTVHPFRKLFLDLLEEIQILARKNYRLWKENPHHPSVRFERKKGSDIVWSAQIGYHYRALCYVEDDVATWFWIGHHSKYDALLENLKAVAQGQLRKKR